MTLTEVLVVVVVLAILAAIILPRLADAKRKGGGIYCVNNVKQIILAFRIWANDHNGKFPMEISTANGGTKGLASIGDAFSTYRIMTNELNTPRILFCPAEPNYYNLRGTSWVNFTAKQVSYFIGLDANTNRPQAILTGDDNFAIGGVPVKSGLLKVSTNAPISWTAERHKNHGNFGLVDGSATQADPKPLVRALIETGLATNRFAIP